MFSKKQDHISLQPVKHNIEEIKYEKIQKIKDTIKSKPISFLSCHQEKLLKKLIITQIKLIQKILLF